MLINCSGVSYSMLPNVEYMASRRLRAPNLSSRDEVQAGYNR